MQKTIFLSQKVRKLPKLCEGCGGGGLIWAMERVFFFLGRPPFEPWLKSKKWDRWMDGWIDGYPWDCMSPKAPAELLIFHKDKCFFVCFEGLIFPITQLRHFRNPSFPERKISPFLSYINCSFFKCLFFMLQKWVVGRLYGIENFCFSNFLAG